MINIMQYLFWISACLILWIYIGYPITLWFLTRKKNECILKLTNDLPKVSIIVPTYNESKVIAKKIENIEALDYPIDKLEVIIVDGASTDNTVSVVKKYLTKVKLITLVKSIGKAGAINQALPSTKGKIIVITDANAFMEPNTLKQVINCFNNKNIGAATGAMRQIDHANNAVAKGGQLYWKLEIFMRTNESKIHSVIGMSGEISAFRRFLFVDENNEVVNWYKSGATDDFEMTMWVIRHGYRVAYAPNASVWEYAPDNISDLFKQKVRIITQTIVSVKRNLSIIFKTGKYGYLIFLSRKLLPLFSPFLLLIILISSLYLSNQSIYWLIIFYLQILFYFLSLIGFTFLRRFKIVRLPHFFILLNLTVLFAWFEYIRGKDYTIWKTVSSTRNI